VFDAGEVFISVDVGPLMWEYLLATYALLRAYHGVRFFLIRRRVRGAVPIVPEAEPFFIRLPGSKKVALLIHGFTTSPKEFRPLAAFLAKNGISSYAPLLPGHGTTPERLAVIKYYQWIEHIEEQIAMLAKEYDSIYLVGNSMGGNLGLICAQKSRKIAGVVTLSTPIYLRNERFNRLVLWPIVKRLKLFQGKKYSEQRAKKIMTEKTWSYQSVPIRSLTQLLKLMNLTRKSLDLIKKPLLLMQVEDDHLVSSESTAYIVRRSPSRDKRIVTIPRSYHMFLLDQYAPKVHREILSFIRKH
jgi:carboxylesterase